MQNSFCTKNDVLPIAMPLYTVPIAPLLQMIKSDDAQDVRHVAFADDLCGAGKLVQLHSWWDNTLVHGPHLCYYPRAGKSPLIVKPLLEERAKKIFAGTDVRMSTNGHKYLGGYIGSEEGKAEYVPSLVTRWCDQIHVLSEFAKLQPQAAYEAFVSGICNRFTYYIRTIRGFETEMQQSDIVIDTKLLPALLSTSIVCPDMSVNCFRCLLDLVVLVYPSSQTFASKKTSTRRPSVNISQATLFSRTTHQRQDAGIASTISANQREAGYKSLLDNLR